MNWPCIQALGDDRSALLVAVIPNARRTEAVGLHDGCLRMRLAAPALDGRANEALIAWLAHQLGVPRRELVLAQGASARRKRLLLPVSAAQLSKWLDGLGLDAA